jgi:hypothetical protein
VAHYGSVLLEGSQRWVQAALLDPVTFANVRLNENSFDLVAPGIGTGFTPGDDKGKI